MINFYTASKSLHTALHYLESLSKYQSIPYRFLNPLTVKIDYCTTLLDDPSLYIAGQLVSQELQERYRYIINTSNDVSMTLWHYIQRHDIVVPYPTAYIPKLALVDAALKDPLPTTMPALLVYQLDLLCDVLRSWISSNELPTDLYGRIRFIELHYPHIIDLARDCLSFEGQLVTKNVMYLWEHGYYATLRNTTANLFFIEIPLQNIILMHFPVRR